MNLELLIKYLPAADVFLKLLGEEQKQWMNANAQYLAPYIQTQSGIDALTMLLQDYGDYVLKQKAVK